MWCFPLWSPAELIISFSSDLDKHIPQIFRKRNHENSTVENRSQHLSQPENAFFVVMESDEWIGFQNSGCKEVLDREKQRLFKDKERHILVDRYIERFRQRLYADIVNTEQGSLDSRVISTHRQELLEVHDTVTIEIKFLKIGCKNSSNWRVFFQGVLRSVHTVIYWSWGLGK